VLSRRASSGRPSRRGARESTLGDISRRNHGELLAHGPDGQIRERDTLGHDPRTNPRLTFGGARG